jgi:hypothetical protein
VNSSTLRQALSSNSSETMVSEVTYTATSSGARNVRR